MLVFIYNGFSSNITYIDLNLVVLHVFIFDNSIFQVRCQYVIIYDTKMHH